MSEIRTIRTTVFMFFECAIKSGKISSEIKLELRSNSTNATSSCDFLLIYVVLLNNTKH